MSEKIALFVKIHLTNLYFIFPKRDSISSCSKLFGYVDNILLAVTGILVTNTHFSVFALKYTYENTHFCHSNTCTTTSLSRKNGIWNSSISSFITLNEHIFLITHANTTFLTSFTISLTSFHYCSVLVADNWLGWTIFLRHIEIVICELESWCGRPKSSIMSINSCEGADSGDSPLTRVSIISVTDLMHVGIPRHYNSKN